MSMISRHIWPRLKILAVALSLLKCLSGKKIQPKQTRKINKGNAWFLDGVIFKYSHNSQTVNNIYSLIFITPETTYNIYIRNIILPA